MNVFHFNYYLISLINPTQMDALKNNCLIIFKLCMNQKQILTHVGICVCSEPYQRSIIQILISDVWTTPTLGSLAMRNLLPPYLIKVGFNNISLYKSLIKLSLVWQMFAISSNLYNINDPGGLAVLVLGLGEIPVKMKFCTWNFASYVFGTKIQF